MPLAKKLLALLLLTALYRVALCAFHKIGDSAGWTTIGNVNYNKWVSTKNFHVGDIIIFKYNNQFHNLKQVTHQDFQSCNATSSMAVYTTGSDSITLKRPGHYYFLCGFPGHCQAGQKVAIVVNPAKSLRSSTGGVSVSPSPAPYGSSPSAASSPIVPHPPKSSAPSLSSLMLIRSTLVSFGALLVAGFAY